MDEELNVLKSIYLDELTISVGPPTSISITIHSNGDENDLDRDKRFLCITLLADLPLTYPEHDAPKISLCRSRGLTDEQLHDLNSSIFACLECNPGSCVLYECIEMIRSKLSEFELPRESCAICLTLIDNRPDVIKTNCHHFYHRHCLASYVRLKKIDLEEQYAEAKRNGFRIASNFCQNIEDPVCRQILSQQVIAQLPAVDERPHNNDDDEDNNRELIGKLSPHVRQWQEQTNALFLQQKEKGGIIDLTRNQDIILT